MDKVYWTKESIPPRDEIIEICERLENAIFSTIGSLCTTGDVIGFFWNDHSLWKRRPKNEKLNDRFSKRYYLKQSFF